MVLKECLMIFYIFKNPLNLNMKRILTLPTWQVFLLLMIPAFFPTTSYVGLILTVIWAGLIAYCTYFVGNRLYEKLPSEHDLNIERFNFCLFFAVAYLSIIILVFHGGYEINNNNYQSYGSAIWIILPMHFLVMYSMFYIIWFIAKEIATVEAGTIVGFDSFAGNFFLLWFFPLGIWWVHPKVRRIFSEEIQTTPAE